MHSSCSSSLVCSSCSTLFFFNDTAPTELYTAQYTLSLHDALPICGRHRRPPARARAIGGHAQGPGPRPEIGRAHVRTPVTLSHLVCRLLLEKKKKKKDRLTLTYYIIPINSHIDTKTKH